MDPDIVLCDVIATDTGIDGSRVVVYDQDFEFPKDSGIFVTVALGSSRIISSSTKFLPADPDAEPPTVDRELKSVVKAETYNVEITSKDRTAKDYYPLVIMALRSTYGQQKMEENNLSIFRTSQVLDLSTVDGSSALHRYRIPVIIHSVDRVENPINVFDRFQTVEEENDVP